MENTSSSKLPNQQENGSGSGKGGADDKSDLILDLNEKLIKLKGEKDYLITGYTHKLKVSDAKLEQMAKENLKLRNEKLAGDEKIKEMRNQLMEFNHDAEKQKARMIKASEVIGNLTQQLRSAREETNYKESVIQETAEELKRGKLEASKMVDELKRQLVESKMQIKISGDIIDDLMNKEKESDKIINGLRQQILESSKTVEELKLEKFESSETADELRHQLLEGAMRNKKSIDTIHEMRIKEQRSGKIITEVIRRRTLEAFQATKELKLENLDLRRQVTEAAEYNKISTDTIAELKSTLESVCAREMKEVSDRLSASSSHQLQPYNNPSAENFATESEPGSSKQLQEKGSNKRQRSDEQV